jgi:hypothetical protein
MALTNFVDGVTKVVSTWLNQVDVFVNTLFAGATTAAAARTAIAAAGTDVSNIFTQTQTLQLTDPGASLGPELLLDRNSASAAASDVLGGLTFFGRNNVGAAVQYGRVYASIVDPVSGTEDGDVRIQTQAAGVIDDKVIVRQGIIVGSATGGDKGLGTINTASTIYQNNDAVVTLAALQTITGAKTFTGTTTNSGIIQGAGIIRAGATASVLGAELLTVKDTTDNSLAAFYNTNAAYTHSMLFVQAETAPSTSWLFIDGRSAGGSIRFQVFGDGSIKSNGVAVPTISSIDTLTNKTLTSPVINSATGIGQAIVKRKTADESVTSSTTLQDDDHLTFAIAANEEWVATFICHLPNTSLLSAHGLKVAITSPTSAVQLGDAILVGDATDDTQRLLISTSGTAATFLAANFGSSAGTLTLSVSIINGANAGSVTLQWAQATSSGTALTFSKGASFLVAHRVA